MEQSAQRELRKANPDWTLSELMPAVATALTSEGPALAFGSVSISDVPTTVSVVIATTGSSGTSKEIGISAAALLASAKASNTFLGAKPGNAWSLLLPLTHIAGVNVIIRALALGTEPVDLRNHAGPHPRADFTAIVPTQLFKALHGDSDLLQHLVAAQSVLVGGAALSDSLRADGEAAGINIVTTYGMTETTGGCVYNGIPLEGVEISITADNLIAIKGPILAEGALRDGWFISSDLGKIEGGKLIVEGRSDGVIISGGENISLSAVEATLYKNFPNNPCAAFAKEDSQWGEALYIAISGENSPSEEELTQSLVEQFGLVGKPKGFLHLTELPLMGIGKVDRKKLIELSTEAPH